MPPVKKQEPSSSCESPFHRPAAHLPRPRRRPMRHSAPFFEEIRRRLPCRIANAVHRHERLDLRARTKLLRADIGELLQTSIHRKKCHIGAQTVELLHLLHKTVSCELIILFRIAFPMPPVEISGMENPPSCDLHQKRRARIRRRKRIHANAILLMAAVIRKIHRLFRRKPLAALRPPNLLRHKISRDRRRILQDMRIKMIEMRMRNKEIRPIHLTQKPLHRPRRIEVIVKNKQCARKPHSKTAVQQIYNLQELPPSKRISIIIAEECRKRQIFRSCQHASLYD